MSKVCTKCGETKSLNAYYAVKSKPGKFVAMCKSCIQMKNRKWAAENTDKTSARAKAWRAANLERHTENCRRWSKENHDRHRDLQKAWVESNRERLRNYRIEYYYGNLDSARAYHREYAVNKRETDIQQRLRDALRLRLNAVLRGRNKVGSAVGDLGCSVEDLQRHLESQFQEGMSWGNWSRDGWHIDHIRPLASFDLTDPDQLRAACHYTNLQPLWARDNLSKGARV